MVGKIVVVSVDRFGRMALPKFVREFFGSNKFVAEIKGKELVLKPVPSWDEAFGMAPNLDLKSFKKEHEEDWE